MPPWQEYKNEAKSRGALAHEFFMVLSTPAGDLAKVKEMLPEHLAYQAQQEEKGVLFLAGPVSDETGEEMASAGLIIYRATNFEAARALAEADPMHSSGARNFILRRWLVNEGSMSISFGLSAQSVRFG